MIGKGRGRGTEYTHMGIQQHLQYLSKQQQQKTQIIAQYAPKAQTDSESETSQACIDLTNILKDINTKLDVKLVYIEITVDTQEEKDFKY